MRALKRVKASLNAVKTSPDAIYKKILPYSECGFENETIMDTLDFLPIDETDGFVALTEGLLDAFPQKENAIVAKRNRYDAGLKLHQKLIKVRPRLQQLEQLLDPLVLPFIFQEYYRFWVDDSRLSSVPPQIYLHASDQADVRQRRHARTICYQF